MPRANRWREVTETDIALSMIELAPTGSQWTAAKGWRREDSLWGKLAQAALHRNEDNDRLWLYNLWGRNGKQIQVSLSQNLYD
jgi:hypothetical protein